MEIEDAEKIRVLLVDDQRLFSENLKLMLETLASDITVVGIASNGREAIDMVPALAPTLVLMDVRMPVLDGVQATKSLHKSHPNLKIVMLTTFLDDTYVQEALNYGAYGYILKNIRPNDLIASLRAISRGAVLFSPDILSRLIPKIDAEPSAEDPDKELHEIVKKLGNREKEILRLVAKGFNNKHIAETLFIAEPTVRNYISSIYAKMGSKNRYEIISIAQKANIDKE